MPTNLSKTIGAAALAVTVGAAATLVAASSASAAVPTRSAFSGGSFGSTVDVGTLLQSGKSAFVPLCTVRAGRSLYDHSAQVIVPGAARIGAVTTHINSVRYASGAIATIARTHTAASTLLGGAIKFTALTTFAKEGRYKGVYHPRANVGFVGLTIQGKSYPVHPQVGQTITIPNLATITLNAQHTSTAMGRHSVSVVAMRVAIASGNPQNLPAGKIVIGSSTAALHDPTHFQAVGRAYGTQVHVGSTVRSGFTAPVYLPCGGTAGVTRKNSTATVALPTALHTMAVHSYARSFETRTGTVAVTQGEADTIDLFGAIKAKAVTAVARANRSGSTLRRSSAGTQVLGLTINGQTQDGTVPANTKYSVPGLGTLYVHKVTRTKNGLEVAALQLVLSLPKAGYAAGTVFTVGDAFSAVK